MTAQHRVCHHHNLIRSTAATAVLAAAVGFSWFYGNTIGEAAAFERAPTVATCYSPDPRPSQEAS